MIEARPQLSVCCLSGAPLARTAVVLDQLSALADEIVCAVDSRVPISELDELAGHADVVVRCEFDDSFYQERNLEWLYSLCSGRWMLHVDTDEVLSAALLAKLPAMLAVEDVVQYIIRRCWSYPDAKHVLDERPWSDDWQVRLIRNEPFCLRIPGALHTSIEIVPPCRYVEEPIYHLVCILSPLVERDAKVALYESISPGLARADGISMNANYYPERLHPKLIGIPREDIRRISEVVAAPKGQHGSRKGAVSRSWRVSAEPVPVVSFEEIDRHWALRSVPASAYFANLELVDRLATLRVNEAREVVVRVRNDGTERWPWGDQKPEIRLAGRWFTRDSDSMCIDGPRTTFVCDVVPGATTLQKMMVVAPAKAGDFLLELGVVHGQSTWFAGALRIAVSIHDV